MTSYTTARTWITGELVTASIANTHWRDNLTALSEKALIFTLGDVAGVPISTGVKGYLEVPIALTVTGWSLVADAAGSMAIDVWKDTWANFPPTVADTIAGSEKPTLTAQQKNQDLALGTWTPGIAAGDVLGFNVDSTSGVIKQASLTLRVTRT